MSSSVEYTLGEDELRCECVGPWATEKHYLLGHYVSASREARRKLAGTPILIDLYCGPGRVRVRGEDSDRDGRVIAALRASMQTVGRSQPCPFQQVFIADLESENVAACERRLRREFPGVVVHADVGPANETALRIAGKLPKYGLHLAYLDPYALWTLPFSVIEAFSRVPKVDLLIHFAALDMARNLERSDQWWRFDTVAPGWRDNFKPGTKRQLRFHFWEHWKRMVESLGYRIPDRPVVVTNNRRSELYRLLVVSKNPLGSNIWDRLRPRNPQVEMFG
jgi:three-Cys-motif partner protein